MTQKPYNTTRVRARESDNLWPRHDVSLQERPRFDLLRAACVLASKNSPRRRSARQAAAMTQPWPAIALRRLSAISVAKTQTRISGLRTGSLGLSGYQNRSQALPKSFDIESIPDCPPVTSASRQCRSPFERDLRRVLYPQPHCVSSIRTGTRGPGDRSAGKTGIVRGLHRVARQKTGVWVPVGATRPAPPNIDLTPSIRGLFPRNLWVGTKSRAVVFRRRPVLKIRACHER
jgi:hypothetical protein